VAFIVDPLSFMEGQLALSSERQAAAVLRSVTAITLPLKAAVTFKRMLGGVLSIISSVN
jgi:hypothetical protein